MPFDSGSTSRSTSGSFARLPFTLAQAARFFQCVNAFALSSPNTPITGYCVDSRAVKAGELFFALKGEKTDGHAFLKEVKEKGAIAAVVSKNFTGEALEALEACGLPLLPVEDPLHALQALAKEKLALFAPRIVAITGSLGKTTTKEFVRSLLSVKYRVAASPGNQNSQIGLPLTILNHLKGDEEVFIAEMGMTLPGHIQKLVEIAPPEVALITSVALVHACNFEGIEGIARAKGEIFTSPATQLGILSRDIPNFEEIARIGAFPKLSFSIQATSKADYYAYPMPDGSYQVCAEGTNVSLPSLPVFGKHNMHNLLAAIAAARHFGMTWEEIKNAIPSLTLPDQRLQFVRHRDILFLNDAYNAAEASVKAALESLPFPEGSGRKIAVLGGVTELGKFSQECHARIGEIALDHVEKMYCLGEECLPIYEIWKGAGKPVELFAKRADLVAALKKELKPFDVVLLKGSHSKEIWKVLEEVSL